MKKSLLKFGLTFVCLMAINLFGYGQTTTYSFTNAGATGAMGPTQAQVNAAYTGTNTLAGNVTVNTQGIQEWTVPATGNYLITAIGACGGEGQGVGFPGKPGTGATISGKFNLTAGTVIKVVVGQKGIYDGNGSGGGGGSFVFTGAPNGAGQMIIAGGGGGHGHGTAGAPTGALGGGGSATTAQVNSTNGNGNGASGGVGQGGLAGTGCSGGGHGSGGAGWLSDGANATCGVSNGGSSTTFIGGSSNQASVGGFGGGGGTDGNGTPGGGGGGYTGGGGGNTWTGIVWGAGAGAGSFNGGTNQTNTPGVTGATSGYTHGSVVITSLCPVAPLVPDLPALTDITGSCSIPAPTAPTATNNCGTVTGTPNVTFPITTGGTTVVTWTYDDGTNTATQTQNVIVAPIILTPDSTNLPDLTGTCIVPANAINPTARNNCGTIVLGTPSVNFPITTPGTTVVTWTFTDGNSTITQPQNVIITPIDKTVNQVGAALTAVAGYSYQWLNCDNGKTIIAGETNQTFTPTLAGNYSVQLTLNGCVDTSACTPYTLIGIDENSALNNVSIYPNPTNGLVNVSLDHHNEAINYTISTVEGRIVAQQRNITTNNLTIDLNNEGKGIYLLKIEDNNASNIYKIVKE